MPVLDTAFAIIRRAAGRQGLATPDKNHLHHRLVRLGHGHRRSVAILWSWTALLSAFVLYPTYNEGQGDGVVPFGVGSLGLLLYTWFHPGVRRADRLSAPPADGAALERSAAAAHAATDTPSHTPTDAPGEAPTVGPSGGGDRVPEVEGARTVSEPPPGGRRTGPWTAKPHPADKAPSRTASTGGGRRW